VWGEAAGPARQAIFGIETQTSKGGSLRASLFPAQALAMTVVFVVASTERWVCGRREAISGIQTSKGGSLRAIALSIAGTRDDGFCNSSLRAPSEGF
jgi:hypothetical protein